MKRSEQLAKLISMYPDHELIFMYPDEPSEYGYTMGHITKIIVDKYWVDDERVWLYYEDYDLILDQYRDWMFSHIYPNVNNLSDEQIEVIEKKTEEFVENQEWKSCICVYIHH